MNKWYHWLGLVIVVLCIIGLKETKPWQRWPYWPNTRQTTQNLASSPNPHPAPVATTTVAQAPVAQPEPPMNFLLDENPSDSDAGVAAEVPNTSPPVAIPAPPPQPALLCQLGSVRFPDTCAVISVVGMPFLASGAEPVAGWNCGDQELRIDFRALQINNCGCQFCEMRPQ